MACTGITQVEVVPVDENPTLPNLIKDDDTTNIKVVPIGVTNDTSTVDLVGMFFNEKDITQESEPQTWITIEKDVLDRSSGYIIGRFVYKVDARAKIVYKVYLDGKFLEGYGTGLPYGVGEGIYDTTLFKYPNGASQNKDGIHKVRVEYALITGITERALGLLDWGELKSKGVADFVIKLLPHKE